MIIPFIVISLFLNIGTGKSFIISPNLTVTIKNYEIEGNQILFNELEVNYRGRKSSFEFTNELSVTETIEFRRFNNDEYILFLKEREYPSGSEIKILYVNNITSLLLNSDEFCEIESLNTDDGIALFYRKEEVVIDADSIQVQLAYNPFKCLVFTEGGFKYSKDLANEYNKKNYILVPEKVRVIKYNKLTKEYSY